MIRSAASSAATRATSAGTRSPRCARDSAWTPDRSCGGSPPYDDGLLIGYRGYDRRGAVPHFPSGHGLGYTAWAYEAAEAEPAVSAGRGFTVRVRLRNPDLVPDGGRPGVWRPTGRPPDRPVRVLAGLAAVTAVPGAAVEAAVAVPARILARWDDGAREWTWPSGELGVAVGRSASGLRLTAAVTAT